MIIKLNTPFSFARQKEEKVKKPLTHTEKVNADRVILLFILMFTIVGVIVFS